MGKIEWTDKTWNPLRGCSRISPGCLNCYAESIAARFSGDRAAGLTFSKETAGSGPFAGFAILTPSGPRWTGKVELVEKHLYDPLKWRKPQKRFISMSDPFHESLPNEDIDRIFAVMSLCPHITFQLLTKRAGRMREYLCDEEQPERMDFEQWAIIEEVVDPLSRRSDDIRATALDCEEGPLPNVHLGVSTENQQTADERIPELLRTPARVRFVSYEPALEYVDFTGYLNCTCDADMGTCDICLYGPLHQIIIGGESGRKARPFDLQWARDTVLTCKAAETPVFVKQMGSFAWDKGRRVRFKHPKGGNMDEWPKELRVREFPT